MKVDELLTKAKDGLPAKPVGATLGAIATAAIFAATRPAKLKDGAETDERP
ncbi:hypothetical protein [Amycolatopsis mediterranei]|uniref:Uncharacterized protein n=1 Tax=Amycolatopsis mediterranei (strain S699) TaxID=713604 RepID=A0A9R0P0K3_AMYMS|nr:hypothetical protein [Amycolatopsis mediterranei]AEK44072.1 hypothetical protein RAM_27975 [Amycolatopsis mediterranei S699]UZF72260.1 hypothetical protein ISP_005589 [Amycolatopsis mediterranei]